MYIFPISNHVKAIAPSDAYLNFFFKYLSYLFTLM